MSAHDRLLELGLSVYEIQIVLEEHSHELAEKIREEMSPPENPLFLSEWAEGLSHAADLIDPHVK